MRELRRRGIMLVSCFVVIGCALWVQVNRARAQNDLSVSPSFSPETPLTPDTPIELQLSRSLKTDEGRIAVVIDHTDVSSLFVADGARLTYVPNLVPLPLGTPDVIVYRVDVNELWLELARFALKVVKEQPALTPAPPPASKVENGSDNKITSSSVTTVNDQSTQTAEVNGTQVSDKGPTAGATPAASPPSVSKNEKKYKWTPTVTFAIKSQPAQSDFPAETRPRQRATFTDETLQFSLRSEAKYDWFSMQTSSDFAGSSFQAEALRFGTLGPKAPQFDLSSYLAQFQLGRVKVAIGHTSLGSARHLVNGFSSRGVTVTVPITKRFDFSAGALNGTNVVGYGNLFGLGKSKHQLQSATLGVELVPKRPGGLRLEFSAVNAYIQALNSVSQGSVNDVERSKGGSVRLIASDKAGRFKFDGAFTRSQYRNPADPLLYQGTNTVAVPFLTRNAHYFDVSYDILRGYSLTKSKKISLSAAVRHEQVAPLFKSLGASAQADKRQNDFQLSGSVGEINFQAGHGRFNDNLRHIASILESLTRSWQFSVALPAAALWGGTSSTSKFLPRLSYSRSEIHQFGAAIPVRGGFETDPSAVPNQYSTSQNFSADWQFQKLNVGYNYSRSFTNNQQRGRERFDFLNNTMGVRTGFNPRPNLSLNFDLTRDSSNDLGNAKLLRTWRAGPNVSWSMTKHISWTAGLSNTIAGDRAETSGSRNTEFDTQFSYRTGLERGGLKKIQSQMFIRYADRYARSHDLVFQTANLTRVKIFNAGVNVTFF